MAKNVIFKLQFDADPAKKGANEYASAAGKVEKANTGIESSFKKIGLIAAAAFSAVAIKNFIAGALKAADEAARVSAKVAQAIKSTNSAAGRSLEQLKEQANRLAKETLFGDDDILNKATAQILTFTNIANEQFDRTVEVALDLATVLDGDVQSASIQLGKALNDPVKNLSALSKSGIQFSEDQKKVITTLANTNRLAEAQTVILDELERQYGGQAKAAAAASDGMAQLGKAFGELQEAFGVLFARIIGPMANGLRDLVEGFTDLITPMDTVSGKMNEDRKELSLLVLEIQTGNLTQQQRIEKINELNKIYPGFIAQEKIDTVTNAELSVQLEKVNEKLLQRIRLQVLQEKVMEAEKELADEIADSIEAEAEAREHLQEAMDALGVTQIAGVTINEKLHAALRLTQKALSDQVKEFGRSASAGSLLSVAVDNLIESIGATGNATSDVADAQQIYNDKLAAFGIESEKQTTTLDGLFGSFKAVAEGATKADEAIENMADPDGAIAGSISFLNEKISALQKLLDDKVIPGTALETQKLIELRAAVEALAAAEQKRRDSLKGIIVTDAPGFEVPERGDVGELESILDGLDIVKQEKDAARDADLAAEKKLAQDKDEILKDAQAREKELRSEASKKYFDDLADNLQREKDQRLAAVVAIVEGAEQLFTGIFSFQDAQREEAFKINADRLEKEKDAELKAAGDNANKKKLIEKEFAAREEQLRKDQFEAEKKAAIQKAIIEGALLVIKSIASGGGVPAGLIFGALAAATVGLQIATIKQTSFAEGGYTGEGGKRDRTGQRVAGTVHEREFVFDRNLTKQFLPEFMRVHMGESPYAVFGKQGAVSNDGVIGAINELTRQSVRQMKNTNHHLRSMRRGKAAAGFITPPAQRYG